MAGVLDALLGQEAGLAKLVQAQEQNKIAREQLEVNRAMAIAQGGGAAMLGLTGGAAIGQGIGNLFGMNPSSELQNVRNNPMQALGNAMQKAGIAPGQEGSANFMRDFFSRHGMFAESEAAYEAGLGFEQKAATLENTRQTGQSTRQQMMLAMNTAERQGTAAIEKLGEGYLEVRKTVDKGLRLINQNDNPIAIQGALLAYASAVLGGGQTTPADVETVMSRSGGAIAAAAVRKVFGGNPLSKVERSNLSRALIDTYKPEAEQMAMITAGRAKLAQARGFPPSRIIPDYLMEIDPNEFDSRVVPVSAQDLELAEQFSLSQFGNQGSMANRLKTRFNEEVRNFMDAGDDMNSAISKALDLMMGGGNSGGFTGNPGGG